MVTLRRRRRDAFFKILNGDCTKGDQNATSRRLTASDVEWTYSAKAHVPAEPSPILPLNVYIDLIKICFGEATLTDQLSAARARVDQFIADLLDYEKTRPSSHEEADALKMVLRTRLMGACVEWVGVVDAEIFREALHQLEQHKS